MYLCQKTIINSLTTRGPGPGPYIDHVLYGGPRAGALPWDSIEFVLQVNLDDNEN